MQFSISIEDPRHVLGFQRALAARNAGQSRVLTETEFAQTIMDSHCGAFAERHLVTNVSRLEFLQRFTPDERVAIRTAAQSSPAVEDYLKLLEVSDEVDLTHALTVAGVQALEAGGLLAEGRAAQILAL